MDTSRTHLDICWICKCFHTHKYMYICIQQIIPFFILNNSIYPPTHTDKHWIRSPKFIIPCSKISMKKERKFKALFATIKSCFLWISSQKTTTKSPRCRWTWTLDEGGGSVEWALAPYSMIKHLDRVSFDSRRYIFVCPRLGSLCTLPIVPKPCWCVSHSPLPKKNTNLQPYSIDSISLQHAN